MEGHEADAGDGLGEAVLKKIVNLRIWSLFMKELHQIRRNRRLVIMLIIPPTLNIVLFGIALNPNFENLRLGIVDYSGTPESRDLISAFTESLVFRIDGYFPSPNIMGEAINKGNLDAGLVIPRDFAERRARHETAHVQLLVDAVNANTATIAGGYAARIIGTLNQTIAASREGRQLSAITMNVPTGSVTSHLTLLYNPGLNSAWFITTGMIGLLLVLQASVVSSASLVREKEVGTIEQLLMTPAGSSEIILAKVGPIFLLMAFDIGLAIGVSRVAFGVPMRGSLLLFFLSASLCVLCGIGMGMMIATFTRTQQQAQLMTFFTNPPLAILSGATTPIEAMPSWLQPITSINPVKHFAIIARGIMLKGSGIEVLYSELLALVVIAFVMVSLSAWRFRKQLS
jgi:ABC-2 type transport system permease protein